MQKIFFKHNRWKFAPIYSANECWASYIFLELPQIELSDFMINLHFALDLLMTL